MKQEDVLREVKTYMEQAKRRLVCSKKSKRDFCRALEASAEEYLQMNPDATVEGLRAYLGDCETMAANFMESLPKREVLWARRKSKILLVGGIVLAALIVMTIFYFIVVNSTNNVQFIMGEGQLM